MSFDDTLSRLELLVRARYALIIIETIEPEMAEQVVRRVSSNLALHHYGWTRSKGLRRGGNDGDPYIEDSKEPQQALAIAEREGAGVFLFRELAPYLSE